MTYNYHKRAGNHRVIITLHGTGADEHDLDAVADYVDDQATLYGLRGDVNERGMLRWFKRHRPGVFDEADLQLRAKNLSQWLHLFAKEQGFSLSDVLFVGFSNGANMIASLLQLYPSTVRYAALLHGQVPLSEKDFSSLSKKGVFVSAGRQDRMISYEQSTALRDMLVSAGADVEFFSHEGSHQITREELDCLKKFYEQRIN